MPFYDVINSFVHSKFLRENSVGNFLLIYRFSIINISKSIHRTDSKPTSFESEDLFYANDKTFDNEIYRFVLQKTSLILGVLVIFTIFLKNWKFPDILSVISRKLNIVAIPNQLHLNRKAVLMLRITRPTKNFIVLYFKKPPTF